MCAFAEFAVRDKSTGDSGIPIIINSMKEYVHSMIKKGIPGLSIPDVHKSKNQKYLYFIKS